MNYEDLDQHNGHTMHDMYMDPDYEINTGELPEIIDEADLDELIDNLNDWD